MFFYNNQNGEVSWHDPRVPREAPRNVDLGPLPTGWEVRFTPSGKQYFVDHNNRTTQFTDPRLMTGNNRQAAPATRRYVFAPLQVHNLRYDFSLCCRVGEKLRGTFFFYLAGANATRTLSSEVRMRCLRRSTFPDCHTPT